MRFLQPIGQAVVIQLELRDAMSSGGLFIPQSAQKPMHWGRVLAVGDKVTAVQEGDTALTAPHQGYRYEAKGGDFLVIDEKHLLATRLPACADEAPPDSDAERLCSR